MSLYKEVKYFLSKLHVGDSELFPTKGRCIKSIRMTINKTKGDAFIVTRDTGNGELLIMRVA